MAQHVSIPRLKGQGFPPQHLGVGVCENGRSRDSEAGVWTCQRHRARTRLLERTCWLHTQRRSYPFHPSDLSAAIQNGNSPRTKTGMKPPQGIGIVVAMTDIQN